MIDTRVLDASPDHQRRDARARTELVVHTLGAPHAWWRDVVPLPAELVVGHDDQRALGLRSVLDRLDEVDEVVAAVRLAGLARMLVLVAEGLDEARRRQLAGLGCVEEVLLVCRWERSGCPGAYRA